MRLFEQEVKANAMNIKALKKNNERLPISAVPAA